MKDHYHILLALAWYHSEVHRGVNAFAREHHCHVSCSMTHYTEYFPESWQGDGVITNLWSEKYLNFAQNLNCPMVGIGKGEDKYYTIQADHHAIAEMIADHLMERGFQHFAWYIHLDTKGALHKRFSLFQEILKSRGFDCHYIIAASDSLSIKEKQQFMAKQLKALPKPLGVMVPEDNSAMELISLCLRTGIYVPEEVSIVSTENDELVCEGSYISLSSVEPNHFQIGYQAMEKLFAQIKGHVPEQHTLIQPLKVITRQSSDVMAVKNLQVAKALSFIKENYLSPISVDDIVASTKLSKCGLFKAFQSNLKRTPGDELLRVRLDKAQELLLNTDLPVKEIALQSGFNDYLRMYKSFVRKLEKIPKEIRQSK